MESLEGGAGDVPSAMSAQSLYAALGLSAEDVEALAQIPESEISVETLPYLIMQLKTKRAEKEAAATDTDYRDKAGQPELETKRAGQEPPSEKSKDRKPSPPSSSSSRRPDSRASNPDEHHGKGDGYKKTERPGTGGKRDYRHRKSSLERQSGDDLGLDLEFDKTPTDFPHVCTICKAKINGPKAWIAHFRGIRHSEARRDFIRFCNPYSDDDSYAYRRSSRSSLGSKRSYSSERTTDLSMSSPSERFFTHYKPFTRVVVAKYPMGCVAVADMLALGNPFGTIVKHLIFPFKGFLEFSSHTEAKDMVTHYQTKPAFIKGHRVSLFLSPTVEVIHPPEGYEPGAKRAKLSIQSVVCFSRLPPGKEIQQEVLELATMFGDIRQSKFTEDKALIEMVDWRDADIMVKYYHTNPLRIQDKSVKVSLSSLSTLREDRPEPSSSKKSDSSKSHSSSRPKNEPTSSKSTPPSSGKDKARSLGKGPGPDPGKDGGGEDQEKDKEKREGEEEKEETEEENAEGIRLEDEHGLADAEGEEGIAMGTEEEEGAEGGEGRDSMEERKETEECTPAERGESKGERGSDEDVGEQDGEEDMDFPDNLDDFVTLDELDNTAGGDSLDSSEQQEGKVVVVRPIWNEFREARKKAVRESLKKMAAPFGKVVNFAISYYRHEALIELETVRKAHEMVNYYKNSKKSKLCGRPVSVSICLAFNRIEGPSRRSLFIRMLPPFKYSDMSLLRLASPFGKITAYCSNRMYGTCYIQMETEDAAEKMIQRYLHRPLKFYGSLIKITMCRKGDSLIPWTPADKFEQWCEARGIKPGRDSHERRENGQTSRNSTDRHSPMSSCEGVGGDPVCEGEDSGEDKDSVPLGPYKPSNPVGLHYVVPKSGFFCRLCNLFFTDERRAREEHCSSLSHYSKLKKRGEVEEDRIDE
ncbi:uncharacterized protein LOC143518758 isoform X2 [Brachyhypopomus gauderio]|uniref:uncharacterized protein LOC143518758 isoform X2 n=1 Tax=Brachyhypopomus gauderio TaxID=698409 RepID=UPI004042FF5B